MKSMANMVLAEQLESTKNMLFVHHFESMHDLVSYAMLAVLLSVLQWHACHIFYILARPTYEQQANCPDIELLHWMETVLD